MQRRLLNLNLNQLKWLKTYLQVSETIDNSDTDKLTEVRGVIDALEKNKIELL